MKRQEKLKEPRIVHFWLSSGAQGRVAVYTSVDKYSNWIYAVMNNMYFCCRECPVIATRKPPYLSCPDPPLAPATSCLDGEVQSPPQRLAAQVPPLPPPRVSPRGRVSLPLLSPHTSLPLLLSPHLPSLAPHSSSLDSRDLWGTGTVALSVGILPTGMYAKCKPLESLLLCV